MAVDLNDENSLKIFLYKYWGYVGADHFRFLKWWGGLSIRGSIPGNSGMYEKAQRQRGIMTNNIFDVLTEPSALHIMASKEDNP